MLNDLLIVDKIKGGCKDSEDKLYKKYYHIIWNYINLNYKKYSKDIDDLTSEIITKIFNNINSYDPSMDIKFKTWVLTITKNHIIDYSRSYYNKNFIVEDFVSNSTEYDHTYYMKSTNENKFETIDNINYLLSEFSKEDYTMLTLKYYHGFNYNEIGKYFNITSSTVSNRINYIKTKIKEKNKLQY